MTVERNRCDFCGEVKDVSRQYLHAARPRKFEETGCDPHTMTRYCNDCGLKEVIVKKTPMTASNPCCEKCKNGYNEYTRGLPPWCIDPSCKCHKETPAAVEKDIEENLRLMNHGIIYQQPAKEWWEDELRMAINEFHLATLITADKRVGYEKTDDNKRVFAGIIGGIISRIAAQSEKKGRIQAITEMLEKEAARSSEEGKTV